MDPLVGALEGDANGFDELAPRDGTTARWAQAVVRRDLHRTPLLPEGLDDRLHDDDGPRVDNPDELVFPRGQEVGEPPQLAGVPEAVPHPDLFAFTDETMVVRAHGQAPVEFAVAVIVDLVDRNVSRATRASDEDPDLSVRGSSLDSIPGDDVLRPFGGEAPTAAGEHRLGRDELRGRPDAAMRADVVLHLNVRDPLAAIPPLADRCRGTRRGDRGDVVGLPDDPRSTFPGLLVGAIPRGPRGRRPDEARAPGRAALEIQPIADRFLSFRRDRFAIDPVDESKELVS